ncbi:MAG: DUF5615 family PIN-like protein [Acidobacteria bacterium]|nr:DUF5615 family PIN-like protein [Acidobacteriota bacterium]MBI3423158.1 DUF5615 family PIN-like protein [Acidobacteriota bacterium]
MKILLDENVPEGVLPAFDRYETRHVNQLGWQGKKNGALLQAASEHGFTVLVTTDVNLYQQRKAEGHSLSVIVLRVFQNSLAGVLPLVNDAQDTTARITPGEVEYLYIAKTLQESDRRRKRGQFAPP